MDYFGFKVASPSFGVGDGARVGGLVIVAPGRDVNVGRRVADGHGAGEDAGREVCG
jgi:hypothetical protein